MTNKRVAIVSAVDPYPVDAGKKVVLAGVIDYLIDRFGADNVHYVLLGSGDNATFPVHLHEVPLPGRKAVLGSLASRTLTGRASLQESFLYSRRTRRAIEQVMAEIGPDVEIYDTIRMAQYVRRPKPHQVCYLDDLFSERYAAMLDAAKRHAGVEIRPLGNFAAHIPASIRPLADRPRFQRGLLRAERRLVASSENRVARRFERSVLVNAREAGVLQKRSGAPASHVGAISPLVPDRVTPRRFTGAPVFVFLGLLSLPHNDDGIKNFLAQTWPVVLEREPNAKLRIIGKEPGEALTSLVAGFPDSVALEGYVPDLGEALGTAVAMLNTLRFGSGIKLKVIEALRAGLPVVSTAIGSDGIAVGAEFGIVGAEDPAAIATAMLELCDVERNREVSAAARRHYVETYSREAVFAQYDKQLLPPGIALGVSSNRP
ncbi:glycosyltransferase family 4 protein [Smaragdicoccus niigatensis]|nr:glycosyltransferase [Smaragdicoccus niigatensis]